MQQQSPPLKQPKDLTLGFVLADVKERTEVTKSGVNQITEYYDDKGIIRCQETSVANGIKLNQQLFNDKGRPDGESRIFYPSGKISSRQQKDGQMHGIEKHIDGDKTFFLNGSDVSQAEWWIAIHGKSFVKDLFSGNIKGATKTLLGTNSALGKLFYSNKEMSGNVTAAELNQKNGLNLN